MRSGDVPVEEVPVGEVRTCVQRVLILYSSSSSEYLSPDDLFCPDPDAKGGIRFPLT
jgi:hypothetical protein